LLILAAGYPIFKADLNRGGPAKPRGRRGGFSALKHRVGTLTMLILDHYWWLIIPGLILGFYAQIKLSAAYGKYSQVNSEQGVSGASAARAILDEAGLQEVAVEEIGGHLTDHYDPMKRALFLSSDNFHGSSLAAIGVSAHEAGHALQHQAAYAPLKLRMALVPVTNFASQAWLWISVLGMILGGAYFIKFISIAIAIF
jgi:uncharacterized protein